MPIYQYVCPKCNKNFDLKQSFNDESVVACPKCKAEARRLFVPVPIIFKGSGFYVTDSKSMSEARLPAKTPERKNESSESKKAEKSAPTKEQDKPKQASV